MRVVEGTQVLGLGSIRHTYSPRPDCQVGLAESATLYEHLVCARVSDGVAMVFDGWTCTYARENSRAR